MLPKTSRSWRRSSRSRRGLGGSRPDPLAGGGRLSLYPGLPLDSPGGSASLQALNV